MQSFFARHLINCKYWTVQFFTTLQDYFFWSGIILKYVINTSRKDWVSTKNISLRLKKFSPAPWSDVMHARLRDSNLITLHWRFKIKKFIILINVSMKITFKLNLSGSDLHPKANRNYLTTLCDNWPTV